VSIEQYQPTAPVPGSTGANLIREAAAVMSDAHALAKAVANTQMIPKHFQGKPDECAAAMLYGASLGLDPMQSVRQIYVVHGQAALYARAMVSLVLGAGHEVWTVESTDESVTVAGRRKGTQHVETSTWTYERAKRAGYTNNEKYRTDPQAMLYSKAASEVCRKIAPDVLSGVYAVEELQVERWDGEVVETRPSKPRGLAAVLPKTSPVPDVPGPTTSAEPEAASEPDQASAGEPMLDPRSSLGKRMFAAMNEAGVTEKGDRLALCSEVAGRPITTSADLTENEARAVIAEVTGGAA